MAEEQQKKSIRDAIMEKIKTGQETMRPKWQFILISALFITSLAIGVLVLIFIASFIFFTLDINGFWFLPIFGLRGIGTFFSSLPWLLILLGIVLAILLEVLARRFSFVYHRSLLYILAAGILLIIVLSLIISHTSLHKSFNSMAGRGRLPIVGPIYRNFGPRSDRGVNTGVISEITDDGFKMDDRQGDVLSVIVTPETVFPSGVDFQKSDQVIVLGVQSDHTVKASGISIINSNSKRNSTRNQGWYRPPRISPLR